MTTILKLCDMDSGAQKWMIRYARKNYWRVSKWYEFEDLIQDGYMTFYKCRTRYPNIKDAPHVMAMFKIMFVNHVTSLSNRVSKVPEIHAQDLSRTASEQTIWDILLPAADEMGTLYTLLKQAPDDLRDLFGVLFSDAGIATLRKPSRASDGTRETNNARLCRLVGKDPRSTDLAGRLRSYLAAA